MDKTARETIALRLMELSGADHTEVLVMDENSALTRFTHNAIHQNVAHADTIVSVRAIVGGRTGVARTNAIDDASLGDVADRALEIAKLAPQDPLLPDLPPGAPFTPPAGAYVPATGAATADRRAALANDIFNVAESSGLWSAGFVTTNRPAGIRVAPHGHNTHDQVAALLEAL